MRRTTRYVPLAVVATVLAAVAVAATAASADGSLSDPAGDGTPDITSVRVSDDAAGTVRFEVGVSDLAPGFLFVDLDTDRNATTGVDGFDYSMSVGVTAESSPVTLLQADGSAWVEVTAASLTGGPVPGGVDVRINRADLGGPTGFRLRATTLRVVGPGDYAAGDTAPDGTGTWTYLIAAPTASPNPTGSPPPAPTPTGTASPTAAPSPSATPTPTGSGRVPNPVFGRVTTSPARPVAGRQFTVTVLVTRSDTGRPLTSGTMTGTARVAGRLVADRESFAAGRARVGVAVPAGASGQVLKVRLTVRLATQSATWVATFRVR